MEVPRSHTMPGRKSECTYVHAWLLLEGIRGVCLLLLLQHIHKWGCVCAGEKHHEMIIGCLPMLLLQCAACLNEMEDTCSHELLPTSHLSPSH